MSVASLPLEILHQIFGYFCIHCREKNQPLLPDAYLRGTQQQDEEPSWYSLDCQNLYSISLVCKSFCRAAQPILYHEFMPGYGDSWRSDLYTWDGRLASFMRAVARRRDLAAVVRRIYIHPYLLESFEDEDLVVQRNLLHHFTSVMPMVRLSERDYIDKIEARETIRELAPALGTTKQKLNRMGPFDLVTLLIALLPGLDHCSIQAGRLGDQMVSFAGLKAAGLSQLSIKTLDVSVRSDGDHPSLFDLAWSVHALLEISPCLETLNLHMCECMWKFGGGRRSFPPLPNLKDLSVIFSRFGGKELEALLLSCQNLRSFTYEAAQGPPTADAPYKNSDLFQLSDAVEYLKRHRTTLEYLHIDLRRRVIYRDSEVRPATASFHDFTALKHLFLNIDEFRSRFWSTENDSELFVYLLPPSIQSLHLAGSIKNELPRLEKALSGLAKAVLNGEFPSVKEVKLDSLEKLHDEHEFNVTNMFAAGGVSFGYDSWPASLSTLELHDSEEPPKPIYVDSLWHGSIAHGPPLPDEDELDL